MQLSALSLSIDTQLFNPGSSPPPVYTPAMQFNDARNSMYVGAISSIFT